MTGYSCRGSVGQGWRERAVKIQKGFRAVNLKEEQLRTRQSEGRQYSSSNAWYLNWNNGNVNNNNKSNNNYVRAVCEFWFLTNIRKRNMEDKITLDEVFEAYMECRRNKRNTCNALAFEADYMRGCINLHRELTDGTYRIGRSIAFLVTRPRLREVFAADFRDRIVHHLIIRRLEPLFEEHFIEDCYNCRKGKGTLYGVKRLHGKIKRCSHDYTRDCYVLKCDLQGFFVSIHKPTLWAMLERFIKERYKGADISQLLWLTKTVVLHCPEKSCIVKGNREMWKQLPPNKSLFTSGDDYGLPIGNLTSQMFANFYLSEIDRWMERRFSHYGRYVDDFYVVSYDKRALLDVLPELRKRLKERLGVTLHPRKIYLQHYTKGVTFIGSTSKMGRLYIGNRTVGNMTETIREMNAVKGKEDYAERFVGRMNSYLGFLGHYRSYAIRRRLLGLVDREWWKYCYIAGHFQKVVLRRQYRHGRKMKSINELKL